MGKLIVFILVFFSLIFVNKDISEPFDYNANIHENIESNLVAQGEYSSPIFTSQKIPNEIYEKMLGNSIPTEHKSKVDLDTLSYLQISYFGFDGKTHIGEMIVNSKLSNEVIEIFKELYNIQYPIEKIRLIDEYGANDELSMSDNNTSCFCYRVISGTSSMSNHSTRMCN